MVRGTSICAGVAGVFAFGDGGPAQLATIGTPLAKSHAARSLIGESVAPPSPEARAKPDGNGGGRSLFSAQWSCSRDGFSLARFWPIAGE
jgi:hypothetical protein